MVMWQRRDFGAKAAGWVGHHRDHQAAFQAVRWGRGSRSDDARVSKLWRIPWFQTRKDLPDAE